MMSGEDKQNDDKKVENSEKEAHQGEEKPSQNESVEGGLLSEEGESSSYPFSLPVDEAPEEAEADQEGGAPQETKLEQNSEPPENDEETNQEDAQTNPKVDDDIEASLDEGLFTNEVLPEEVTDDQIQEVQSSDEVEETAAETLHETEGLSEEDIVTDGDTENAASLDEADEKHDPEIVSEDNVEAHISNAPDAMNVNDDSETQPLKTEQPNHAFDMGEPEISEKEFSEVVEKKSRLGTIVAGFVILFLLIGVAIGGGFLYVNSKFDAPGSHTQSLTHVIKPKQGLKVIAEDLEKKGIIEDKNIFMLGSFLKKSNKSLKAGEFEFAPNASMSDVLDTITRGKVLQHKITFAEGLTTQKIVETINNNPVLSGEIEKTPDEGTLLPETYQFERGMTRQQIIDRMQKAQSDLIEKLWPERDDNLGVVTPGDALILASIIEKETGLSSERNRVSSVFNNRLRKNMRLQSDPTVIYGIVGGAGKLDRPIRRSDLDAKNPYNTYQIKGLPPTPIANPGKASIEAALKPAKTDDLYFVADGTGGHAFATNLKAHNENVARWRKLESGVAAPESSPIQKTEDVAKKVENKVQDKKGVLKKTTTLNTDKKVSAKKPQKSDLVVPVEKPKIEAPQIAREVSKQKENLTEKVKSIFVKPEEAPLPRQKPNSLVKQGIDRINVSPLPEQKVPQVNVNAPSAPSVNTPGAPNGSPQQVTPPGAEPTPELESVKPAPTQKPFNPFGD